MNKRHIAGALAVLAGGLGLGVFLVQRSARSADHQDSPSARANPAADLNDVYTWMAGSSLVVATTAFPAAPYMDAGGALFSTSGQYVVHITNHAAYVPPGMPQGTTNDYDIMCTFSGSAAPQTTTCWGIPGGAAGGMAANEYVTGNANQTTGISSADGKLKVFAGLRGDPFYFNLDGFHAAEATVEALAGSLPFNDAGCPHLTALQAGQVVGELSHGADGGAAVDHFATFNTLAIVITIDKSVVTTSANQIVSVWAGTYN